MSKVSEWLKRAVTPPRAVRNAAKQMSRAATEKETRKMTDRILFEADAATGVVVAAIDQTQERMNRLPMPTDAKVALEANLREASKAALGANDRLRTVIEEEVRKALDRLF